MTAIWKDDGDNWTLLPPSGFPDEATLHDLVERSPQLLPLSGNPTLAVVGREVNIGGNRTDLVAVEQSGRLAIIEIKLSHNAEARRAVIAQILTYAAYLRGMEPSYVEEQLLGKHLNERGFASLAEAVQSVDQVGAFNAESFQSGLSGGLQEGSFRLVLVLDDAPPELVKLVGYLEAVTDKLLIDLITVASFEVGGSRIVVPRRVDPEREPASNARASNQNPSSNDSGILYPGREEFLASLEGMNPEQQAILRRLADWAVTIEERGWTKLSSYIGKSGRATLLLRVTGDDAGLVTIWNYPDRSLSLWRSVFDRLAPQALMRFDEDDALPKIRQPTFVAEITDQLLTELTDAYREAATGGLASGNPVQ